MAENLQAFSGWNSILLDVIVLNCNIYLLDVAVKNCEFFLINIPVHKYDIYLNSRVVSWSVCKKNYKIIKI